MVTKTERLILENQMKIMRALAEITKDDIDKQGLLQQFDITDDLLASTKEDKAYEK